NRTSYKKNRNSQSDWHVYIQNFGTQTFVCRNKIAASRIENHGQRKRKHQPAEKGLKLVQPKFRMFKIFGEGKKHDVSKGEASYSQFINQASVYVFLLFIGIVQ